MILISNNNEQLESSIKEKVFFVFDLCQDEVIEIRILLDEIAEETRNFEDPEFLMKARIKAFQLPERLVEYIVDFKYQNGDPGAIVIRGMKFSGERKTPQTMEESQEAKRDAKSDLLLILLSSLLGEVFGWSSQRNGDIINDIFPLKGNENEQLSTGSKANLAYHTEEAFHPFRADYIGMTCVRNTEMIGTQVASVKDLELSNETRKILSEERFFFEKDKNFENDEGKDLPEAVLFGSKKDPYLRIDPSFMHVDPKDEEAKKALQDIARQLYQNLEDMVLESGDYCFIDNYFLVHGRKSFTPLYDGNGRWLKRVNISTDLRKSRAVRSSGNSRVITPIQS